MVKFLFTLLLIISYFNSIAQVEHGTEIFYMQVGDSLFIGADSKISHNDGLPPSTACKIFHYKSYVWAKAGLYNYYGKFSMDTIIENIIKKRISPKETFRQIRKIACKKMNEVLPDISSHKINQSLSDSVPLTSTIIATFENHHLIFEDASYLNRNGEKGRIVKDSVLYTEKDIRPDEAFSDFFGSHELSKKFLDFLNTQAGRDKIRNVHFEVNDNPDFKLNSIENLVYYLIYVQTKTDSINVGGPISVILFDNAGYHWKYNDLHCP